MQEILTKERANIDFDVKKLQKLVHGENLDRFQSSLKFLAKQIPYDPNIFNEGRIQMIKKSIHQVVIVTKTLSRDIDYYILASVVHLANQIPYGLHYAMFITCINMLASDQQRQELIEKCYNFQLIGCYAQTQMGHGSDVQSLQTTATYDRNTDELILNSPTIASTKFWPGDLGIFADHAMVFARLMVDDGDLGVYPFLVRIRDKNYAPLEGIQVGDIGPKFGFLTKDNGFLRLHQVRIPRTNMLSKYIGLSREGQLQVHGNPKIVYATMMIVRKLISTVYPKTYGQGIAIACRYSMFRKQFKNQQGEQQPIIKYQLQQFKLIPLIAEFYALCLAGNRVAKLTQENFRRVKNDDETLMNQTHASLCYTKAYFSDVVTRGLEVCRLSCGGHGFAQYSGLPNIIREFTPNVTHQGQNSIMYLQVARYIMKSYKASVLKKKRDLLNTVKYLNSIDYYRTKKCSIPQDRPDLWTIQQVRLLLGKSVCHLIDDVYQKQVQNPGGSKQKTNDQFIGIRMVQMAIAHCIYNTYTCFQQTLVKFPDERLKKLLFELCMVYGISNILSRPNYLLQSDGIQAHHLISLRQRQLILLKNIRPYVIGLVDGIGLGEQNFKSPLVTSQDPYQKLFQIAKRSSLNTGQGCISAVQILKKGLKPKL